MYFDRQGKPMALRDWAMTLEDAKYRIVRQEMVSKKIRVSTVWLGIDISAALSGRRPMIFETMIFGGKHDLAQWRYHTEAEALEGHKLAVDIAKGLRKP